MKALAIVLPQFHPVPENDEWWGKGFTEWTNVAKARPRFPGHYQPHLPSDLGFYDLRLPEARQAQADLAREYGIHGFVYYHYWFTGRRILERPVDDMIRLGEPDFPFCLCWANENWSRRWDGEEKQVLLKQDYSDDDDLAHIKHLIPYFQDHRYIRVHGKPVFLVYKLSLLPDPARTISIWRKAVASAGLPGLYLCNVESNGFEHSLVGKFDLDAAVEFAPDWKVVPPRKYGPLVDLLPKGRRTLSRPPYSNNLIHEYPGLVENMLAKPTPPYYRYPGVTPMWDNSARRKEGAFIAVNSTPELYGQWLEQAVRRFKPRSPEEDFVFINAWNEWAEGNHLEPCHKWGRKYLEATRSALAAANATRSVSS